MPVLVLQQSSQRLWLTSRRRSTMRFLQQQQRMFIVSVMKRPDELITRFRFAAVEVVFIGSVHDPFSEITNSSPAAKSTVTSTVSVTQTVTTSAISTVTSSAGLPTKTSPAETNAATSNSLSSGEVAAITIGVTVPVVIVTLLGLVLLWRRRKRNKTPTLEHRISGDMYGPSPKYGAELYSSRPGAELPVHNPLDPPYLPGELS